jgi:hypothetical protein
MPDNFKTEYIAELMIAGYTLEEAEEQYQMELKEIQNIYLMHLDVDDNEDY